MAYHAETQSPPSPPASASPRSRSRSNSGRPNLSIKVPPMQVVHEEMTPEEDPLPPSNVLLISHLTPDLMKEEMLGLLRNLINPHAPIWTWNLDRKRSSIKISFYDIRSAKFIKEALEREPILDCTPRVRYAPPFDSSPPLPQYLEPPRSEKLFFISPPPSPPHDWEMRNEEPPNSETHAHDLALALSRLDTTTKPVVRRDVEMVDANVTRDGRARSSSVTMVYHPEQHGSDPALPTISVEDTEAEVEMSESPKEQDSLVLPKTVMPKTERPPSDLEG